MKKIILIICLMFVSLPAWCADYIYINDTPLRIRSLPDKWTFGNGRKTGNFSLMSASVLIAEGWRKVTVKNNKVYDSETQTRTLSPSNIVVFADHAEITYTVTDKGLNAYKRKKGRAIIAEGRAILNAKYDNDWESGYDADKATLKNYFINTVRPLIIAASTLQEVKAINNGDEYTWPIL